VVQFEKRAPSAAKEVAEKVTRATSGAKAQTERKRLIAALKRCATQKRSFSAAAKAAIDSRVLTARLKPRPFKTNSN
jgi:hypothetical protein